MDPETDIYFDDPATVNAADTSPKTLTVHHFDQPDDKAAAVVTNSLTGEDNFIREAQLEFLFCTVLSARDPAGSARSHVIEGEPTDKRFKDFLTDASVRGCNAIIPLYAPLPDGVLPVGHPNRRESNVWQNFNIHI